MPREEKENVRKMRKVVKGKGQGTDTDLVLLFLLQFTKLQLSRRSALLLFGRTALASNQAVLACCTVPAGQKQDVLSSTPSQHLSWGVRPGCDSPAIVMPGVGLLCSGSAAE